MSDHFAKEHDLLKLCDKLEGSKIHYCPSNIAALRPELFLNLTRSEGFRSLKHHCVLRYGAKSHSCVPEDLYPIGKEEFCLAMADMLASAISRRLNIGFRKGPNRRDRIIWNTYHFWMHEKVSDCTGEPPADETVLTDICSSGSIPAVFEERLDQIRGRSEDAWKCPFASLLTHSELTEKWYRFLVNNSGYFGIPPKIETFNDARTHYERIRWRNVDAVPICFLRLKLFANQSLSRIPDVEIIERISAIIKKVPERLDGSQELYTLADEIILVLTRPAADAETYVRERLEGMEGFSTNYYFEGTIAEARLRNEDLLAGYNDIFLPNFRCTFYPDLNDKIDPEAELSDPEAYSAKLCELCNMNEATRTFWKSNDENQKVHECLCQPCFDIRTDQEQSEGEEDDTVARHGRGYLISRWERHLPDSKVCFVKIDLDLSALSDVCKDALLAEFPLKNPADRYRDENIGFSIIHEFLSAYREFVTAFNRAANSLNGCSTVNIDPRTGVPNRFDVFDNFLCFRFDRIYEIKATLQLFMDLYCQYFPWLCGLPHGKNRNSYPMTYSATIGDIKFPFFEAWRYLNSQKPSFINILVVRRFQLQMAYAEYEKLSSLDFSHKRISAFLHRLAGVERRTGSSILVQNEIFNNRVAQSGIFNNLIKGHYTAEQLINYYKLGDKGEETDGTGQAD